MADDNTKLVIVLEAQAKKLQNSLTATNRLIDRFAAQTERRFDQMNKKNAASFERLSTQMRGSIGGLQNLLGPLVGTIGAREVIRFADAWAVAGNKIAAAGQVAGIVPRSLDELKDSANSTRTSIESYVDLYARLLRSSTEVAAGELEVARATEIVAKSLKAGGASAQEQQAALVQLGQALGSGILQGDELRSIRENAPLIARALAKEFNVSIGELKQLGAEGKLTSDRVFKAILAGGTDIDAAFKATKSTIQDAFTRINNEFTAYIGTAGRASGATQALIDALNYLADNFQMVGDAVATFALVLATVLAGKAVGAVVIGLGQAVVALATFLAALSTGTLTVAVFSAALGPIAILASAAAVAVGLYVYAMEASERVSRSNAEAMNSNAAAIEVAADASKEYRESLRRQISMQLEAAKAAIEEAKAQSIAAAQKAALFQSLAGTPLVGPALGVFGGGAFANIAVEQNEIVKGNEKFIEKLNEQLAQLDALGKGVSTGGGGDKDGAGGKDNEFQKKLKSVIEATHLLERQTDAQAALNPLTNDYGYSLEFVRTQQELLNAAAEVGIPLNKETRATIDVLAEGYATASVEAKKLAESQDEFRDKAAEFMGSLKDVTRGWIDDLIEGKSAAEALGNALSNVGNRLINMGLDGLFGTGSGSNPYGVIGKLFGFAKGGVASNGRPKAFANGGVSNTAAVFGEAGPEAAVPLPDGRRIPVDLRMPQGGGRGSVSVPISIEIDATGADAAGLARVENQIASLKATLPATVVATVRKAKKQRQL